MIRIPSHPILALLLLTGSLLGKSAPSDRNVMMKPTIARDGEVQVRRGGDVEIFLKAIPSYGNMESFVIQSTPLHGTLTDPKNSSDHTASVIYHHDGTKSPLSDTFTFRVKAPGQAISSPAHVQIRITPPTAKLVFKPDSVDFGGVVLSEKKTTNVVLSNLGGTRAAGRLLFQAGLSAPNGDKYNLEEGESVSLPIEFSPSEAKAYDFRVLSLPAFHDASLGLQGTGLPRFEVSCAEAVEGGGPMWILRNLSDSPLRLSYLVKDSVRSGSTGGWILPKETVLPPHSVTNVTLHQDDDEGNVSIPSIPTSVHISDGLTESLVELPPPTRFIPVTVQLKAATDQLPIGGALPLSFTLFNRSDLPKSVFWKITSPLGGGMDQSVSVDLRGGETKEIQYNWKPTLPGKDVVRLFVDEGKKSHAELLWKIAVLSEPVPLSPPPVISQQKAPDSEMTTESGGGLPVVSEPLSTADAIPPLDDVAAKVIEPWFTAPECIIRWRGKSDSHVKFLIQESLLVPKQGVASFAPPQNLTQLSSMNLECRDLRPVSIKSDGDFSEALIRGLDHGYHQILISRITDGGKVEARSWLKLYIPSQKGWWDLIKAPLGAALIILLIFFLKKIKGRQQP